MHFAVASLVLLVCLAGLLAPVSATAPLTQNAVVEAPFAYEAPGRQAWSDLLSDNATTTVDTSAQTRALGLLHEQIPEDARVTPIYAAGLPTHFDWRSSSGYNWMTPVKNQASCGSCVAFAAVGATEGQLKIRVNNPSWNPDLSEQHLFSCGGGLCGWGWYISSALNRLRDYGTPDEACSPYQSGDGGDRSCPTTCSDGSEWQPRAYKISSWNWIATSPSSIQAALMNGPLVAAFDVYTDFFYYTGGIYRHTWGVLEGGHAIVIVGYDSNEQYWIVKNSWGNWGESGYFRIAFGQVGIEQEVASLSISASTATVTVALTQASTSYPHGTTTKTATSYTGTSTSTSTIQTFTTVALALSTVTSILQSINYLTSVLTTTVTSYIGTQTSTSTVLVPATVAVGPSTMTTTVRRTEVLTSTGTSTVTAVVTTTTGAYSSTTTSTSTSVVHTTVTVAGPGGSAPLAYFGFLSLMAVAVGQGAATGRGFNMQKIRLCVGRRWSSD